MASKIEAYVDTSALIAFLDRGDIAHTTYLRLFGDPPNLVTSALVLAEGHGWFLRRHGTYLAGQFLDFISELDVLTVVPFDGAAFAKAGSIAKRFADQRLSLADAHGLAIMKDRRVRSCWSTDHHMGITGVRPVR